MILRRQFSISQLKPTTRPELATTLPYRLPVGANYVAGRVLALSNIAARAELRTLTISGTPTGGTFTPTYTADKVYTGTACAHNAAASVVQASLETIFGAGNVTVSGSAGGPYACTFANSLANVEIAGTFGIINALTGGTSPTGTWAQTTKGSSGAGQAVAYVNGGPDGTDVARVILAYDYVSDPMGGVVTEHGTTQQAYTPACYVSGYFLCSELTGLDADGAADLGKIVVGTAFNSTGAVLKM